MNRFTIIAVTLLGLACWVPAQSPSPSGPDKQSPPQTVKDSLGLVIAARPFPTVQKPEQLTNWALAARMEVLAAIRESQDRGDQRAGARLGLRLEAVRRHVWNEVSRLRGDRAFSVLLP